MLIRSERLDDISEISGLLADSFRRPDSPEDPIPEVGLVVSLRGSNAWIPQQSLVAVFEDEVLGYCLCTRAHVRDVPCLALGPIGVAPARQRQGVGTALMNQAIEIAIDMGEPLIGLLGDYRYYRRFGFVPSGELGIDPPEPSWGAYFQIKTLPAFEPVTGLFRYADAFRALA